MPLAGPTKGKLEQPVFYVDKCLGHLLKRFSALKRQSGHLGDKVSSASCDHRLIYPGDPSDPISFKVKRSAKCSRSKWLGKASSGSNERVLFVL